MCHTLLFVKAQTTLVRILELLFGNTGVKIIDFLLLQAKKYVQCIFLSV